jgi:hypothetical protein
MLNSGGLGATQLSAVGCTVPLTGTGLTGTNTVSQLYAAAVASHACGTFSSALNDAMTAVNECTVGCGGNMLAPVNNEPAVAQFDWLDPLSSRDGVINDGYYLVEKSKDNIDYSYAYFVRNQSTSDVDAFCQELTNHPIEGYNYYRVNAYYNNGTFVSGTVKQLNAPVQDVMIFPNPAQAFVKAVLTNFENQPGRIQIFSAMGSLVYDQAFDALPENTGQIDLSGNARGVYYFKVQANDQKPVTKKLVLMW